MRTFRAAVVQLRSGEEVESNLAAAERLTQAAVVAGAEFVALPENFAYFRVSGERPEPRGPIPGPLTERMAALARRLRCYLLLGGVPEEDPRGGLPFNTSVLLSPEGAVLARYRKRHLFEVTLPDGTALDEAQTMQAGAEIVAAATPLAVLGLSICYDLRFPEHYQALRARGAEVLTVPSAFTRATGAAHWHILCRARAIENQCFLLAPDQAGHHGGRRESFGHSLIVDPWGAILAEVVEEEGFAVATLDVAQIEEVRARMPMRHLGDAGGSLHR